MLATMLLPVLLGVAPQDTIRPPGADSAARRTDRSAQNLDKVRVRADAAATRHLPPVPPLAP